MSQLEPGPSRRRRTTRACNNCRRRRCKCDGVQPTCGTCSLSGHECSWLPDDDDTRPATKQYVESLRVKVQMLESEIAQLTQSNQAPASSSPAALSPTQTLTDTDHELTQSSYTPSVVSDSEQTLLQTPLPPDNPTTRSPPTPTAQPPMVYQYIFNIDTSIPIEQQTPEVQASLDCQWNRYLPDLGTVQLTRFEHDTILSRCFNYGTSWLYSLVPNLFLREMVDCLSPETINSQSRQYTPALHCSLLAIAVAFSDNPVINTPAIRDQFAAHAKQWLDESLNHPTPGLVPCLSVLSEHHYGIAENYSGLMYTGMSVRATRIPTRWINPALQDWYQWTCFVQEKLAAVDNKIFNETPVPRVPLYPSTAIELGGWPRSDSFTTDTDYTESVTESFAQLCKLMVIASRMIDNVFSAKSYKNSDVIDIHLQLEAWFNALPEGLLVGQHSTMTLPHVLSLHLCYWRLMLDLHLPIFDRIHPLEPEPRIESHTKTCDHAAEKLIHLLVTFDAQHSLRFFPRNMLKAIHTCGCALLIKHTMPKKRAAQEGVDLCISALRAISNTWPCAGPLADDLENRAMPA